MLKYRGTGGRNVKRLGILVDEQTVAQYAMANGISKTGKEMTQTQKLQARYGAIMQQTAKAQGDLARTMDSPTNQLRRLNAEFDMAKIALGQALQPALIAVLPHVTNFATGLTRMLKGGSGGDPLSGTINDLAGATAAIKSRVDTSIVDIIAEIARLQDATETAVDGYIQAASEVRDLYINITLKPQNTVYERINSIFAELDSKINTAATLALMDGVKAQLNIILQDGEVTGPERQSLLDYLTETEARLKKQAEEKLKAIQADVRFKLNAGDIDLPTADQMLKDAQAEYDTSVGVIEGLMAQAAAEIGIKDWTAYTISADDRQRMTEAINKQIAAEDALLVSANAQVQALFEGSSLEQAVLGMYGDLTTKINANNTEINKLLTAWLDEDDGAAYEKAMAKREENQKLLAIASGGLTAEGKINKALLAIGGATPEEITSFAKGYKDIFGSMTEGYIERGQERENVLYNMPDSYFAKQGTTRQQMLAENSAETNAAVAQANAMLLKSAADAMVPQLQSLMNNAKKPEEVNYIKDMIFKVLNAVDYSDLNEGGKKAVQSLVNVMDNDKVRYMFGSDTNFFGTIDDYLRQIYNENYGKGGGVPMPNPPWQTGAVPEITIDRPRLTVQDPLTGTGQGMQQVESNLSVSIAPLTINTAIELDGTTLGRATITAQQTVVKNTGGGKGLPGTVVMPMPY